MFIKSSGSTLWRTGTVRLVFASVLWLLLLAVCWKRSIFPGAVLFGGASLVSVVGCVTIPRRRVLWVNIGGISVAFLLAELYCRIVLHGGMHAEKGPLVLRKARQVILKPDDSWVRVQDVDGSAVYWFPEPLEPTENDNLQYRPNARARSKRVANGITVFDATYSTNEHGFRNTPAATPGGPTVAFWGCSFTFGRGLNDDQTLPNQFAAHSKGRFSAINFGLSGHAPNSALAILEENRERPSTAGSNIVAGVYVTMGDHPRRVLGGRFWTLGLPRYVLRDGVPVRNGVFTDSTEENWNSNSYQDELRAKLGKLAIGDVLLKEWGYRNSDLNTAILKRTAEVFEARYHAPFVVIAWLSDTTKDQAIRLSLVRSGLRVIDLDDLLRSQPETITIPGDGHPNAFANGFIADKLLAYFETKGIGPGVQVSTAKPTTP